jgi:hypothetical protein
MYNDGSHARIVILADAYGTYASYDKEDLITGLVILEAHLKGR